jgi:hypothetical protein
MSARDLAEARRILEQRGYREIRFAGEPIPDFDGDGMREKALVPPGLPLWQIMGPNSLVLAALLAWCVWDLAHGGDVLWNVVWIVGGLLFCLFVTLPAGVYPALRADRAWGRWAAMRRKARFLQLTSGVLGLRMVRLLVDFELVRALAGLNRLPEALATVARHRDGTMEHRAFYLGMIVSLYEIAGDFDAGGLRIGRAGAERRLEASRSRDALRAALPRRTSRARRARATWFGRAVRARRRIATVRPRHRLPRGGCVARGIREPRPSV